MSRVITCNRCGESGFSWSRTDAGKWILLDATGKQHLCSARKQFIAKTDSVCPECGEEIKAGVTPVRWPRRGPNTGIIFHEGCLPAVSDVAPVSVATTAPMPATATLPATTADEIIARGLAAIKASLESVAAPTAAAKQTKQEKSVSLKSDWWTKLEGVIVCGFTRVMLIGPPGTGKSTTADRDGLRVTCHEDAGPESMIGTFIQKDGNTVWIDGPCVMAMRKGTRIVLDEIDHTSPECISLLYALLDDSPSIMLPTGEYVQAAKGYQVVCTSNGNPADLPDAILDRIEAVVVADVPHEKALESIDGPEAEKLQQMARNYYRSVVDNKPFDWKGNPTLRRMRNFSRLLSAGMNVDVAAQAVFGSSAKEILSALTTVAPPTV